MKIKAILYDFIYLIINYVIAYIPCWTIRKLLYKLLRMKIGKGSRINMKCTILNPWSISIGAHTIVNEYCLLDGRGELQIGANCSISMYSVLYTASHEAQNPQFKYYEKKTNIGDGCWIGVRTIILPGVELGENCITGAGSVLSAGEYSARGIYAGIPAKRIKDRAIDVISEQEYLVFFR